MVQNYKIRFTAIAYQDIDNTLDYISKNLCNPIAASNLYDQIESTIPSLKEFPYSFPDCQNFFLFDDKYRHVIIGNYGLFFRIKDSTSTVEILRFLYLKIDFSKINIVEKGQ